MPLLSAASKIYSCHFWYYYGPLTSSTSSYELHPIDLFWFCLRWRHTRLLIPQASRFQQPSPSLFGAALFIMHIWFMLTLLAVAYSDGLEVFLMMCCALPNQDFLFVLSAEPQAHVLLLDIIGPKLLICSAFLVAVKLCDCFDIHALSPCFVWPSSTCIDCFYWG